MLEMRDASGDNGDNGEMLVEIMVMLEMLVNIIVTTMVNTIVTTLVNGAVSRSHFHAPPHNQHNHRTPGRTPPPVARSRPKAILQVGIDGDEMVMMAITGGPITPHGTPHNHRTPGRTPPPVARSRPWHQDTTTGHQEGHHQRTP